MTPLFLADLMAESIPPNIDAALDLAAGDGSLLAAIRRRNPSASLFGFEIDANIHRAACRNLPGACIGLNDGLSASSRGFERIKGNRVIVSNPPFCEFEPTKQLSKMLVSALPGTTTRHGLRHTALYFLARALLLGKSLTARVLIVLPISFAESDFWVQYRRVLTTLYRVDRSIELPSGCFGQTEARAVLLDIRTDLAVSDESYSPIISQCEKGKSCLIAVYQGSLEGAFRLDARHYSRQSSNFRTLPSLKEYGVTVTRGRTSRKEAHSRRIGAIHTGDLRRSCMGRLRINQQYKASGTLNEVFADPGDILLPRTGSRIGWHPVVVTSGSAPITDHVFRVRFPRNIQTLIEESFRHPQFIHWLTAHIKGVCAAVLSKSDLMNMPVFSSQEKPFHRIGSPRTL